MLAAVLQAWEGRPDVYRRISSVQWQAVQRRFLPLTVLPLWEATEEFEGQRDARGWSYRSTAQYWSALLKAMEAVGLAPPPEMRVRARLYSHLGKEEDERRATVAVTRQQLLAAAATTSKATSMLMRVAFELGQRVGDCLTLKRHRLAWLDDAPSGLRLLAVQFRKGKTVRRRDPFTLHLHGPIAHELAAFAAEGGGDMLFGDDPVPILNELRKALKDQQQALSVLSVRRGGLQALAASGVSEATLLHHSRHTSAQLLHRYLEWGTYALGPARERYSVAAGQLQPPLASGQSM